MNAPASRSSSPMVQPLVRAATLALAFGSALACTAILAPKDDVTRCGTADDCEPTGDNRYVPICKFDDAHSDLDSTKTDKICVADYKPIGCDPMLYSGQMGGMHPFFVAFESSACTNISCTEEMRGTPGCPPVSGMSCPSEFPGDTIGDTQFCTDPNADQPTIGAAVLSAVEGLEGQHVKDQFCKSFFCDDEFVCNKSFKCQRCDPDEEYGDGGCGLVYSNGAPARIYVLGDALSGACANEDASVNDIVFGACS